MLKTRYGKTLTRLPRSDFRSSLDHKLCTSSTSKQSTLQPSPHYRHNVGNNRKTCQLIKSTACVEFWSEPGPVCQVPGSSLPASYLQPPRLLSLYPSGFTVTGQGTTGLGSGVRGPGGWVACVSGFVDAGNEEPTLCKAYGCVLRWYSDRGI